MKKTNIIRNFLLGSMALFIFSASTFAAPLVRRSAAASAFELDPAVFQFRGDLGGNLNSNGGSYQTGYRQINWNEFTEVNTAVLPKDYYNTTVPGGVVLSSACTYDGFQVSASLNSQDPLNFGDINPHYATDFKPYDGYRVFSAMQTGCNVIDVYFYIPGTKIPATVQGFGAVLSDVDNNNSSSITYFGIDGKEIIAPQTAVAFNNGLSFVGVTFNGGERIAHVRVSSGTGALGAVDKSRGGQFDVVVMSSFYYSEPKAIGQHSSDFDGDSTSDLAVYRPTNGSWYILNSGSNTISIYKFGLAGDIPVDGDFDGDSRNDLAVFRPSNGGWFILRSSTGQVQSTVFGLNGDKPTVGDYDKDGKTDIAVWRPSDGNYYSLNSSNGQVKIAHFGANGDIPIGAGGQ